MVNIFCQLEHGTQQVLQPYQFNRDFFIDTLPVDIILMNTFFLKTQIYESQYDPLFRMPLVTAVVVAVSCECVWGQYRHITAGLTPTQCAAMNIHQKHKTVGHFYVSVCGCVKVRGIKRQSFLPLFALPPSHHSKTVSRP